MRLRKLLRLRYEAGVSDGRNIGVPDPWTGSIPVAIFKHAPTEPYGTWAYEAGFVEGKRQASRIGVQP